MYRRASSVAMVGLTPYDLLRIVLGVLLVSAAFLKGHQLAEPDLETGPWSFRWIMIGLIQFELVLGVWLLSGLRPRAAWRAAIGCFVVFGLASLYKVASGEGSCDCFGNLPVNPWLALVIDTAAVTALCRWQPDAAATQARFVHARVALIVIAFLGAPAFASVAATHHSRALTADGQIVGDSGFVLLEPANWLDKPCPLLAHIDIGERLASGRWLVVLFRHDCAHCREAIAKYDTLAGEWALDRTGSRVALVEVPPYLDSSGESDSAAGACPHGRLSDSKQWWLRTPTVLRLEGGWLTELLDESSSDEYGSFSLRERS